MNLIDAIVKNDVAEVKRLLETGADVNAKDENGWTPLHLAARKGYTGIVKLLRKHGGIE